MTAKVSNVSHTKYGAPMGRPDEPRLGSGFEALKDHEHKFTLQRVRLDRGGYDSGGAYWGVGQPLYWAMNEQGTIERRLRGVNREGVKAKIRAEFPNCKFWR